jgi:hypothetical protein
MLKKAIDPSLRLNRPVPWETTIRTMGNVPSMYFYFYPTTVFGTEFKKLGRLCKYRKLCLSASKSTSQSPIQNKLQIQQRLMHEIANVQFDLVLSKSNKQSFKIY